MVFLLRKQWFLYRWQQDNCMDAYSARNKQINTVFVSQMFYKLDLNFDFWRLFYFKLCCKSTFKLLSSASVKAPLHLQWKLYKEQHFLFPHQCLWCFFLAEKLKIITPLKDTEAREGQEVVLNCEVNTEGAKAKWLKNEETVFESSKYVMVQRDNVFSLRIRDAQKGDEANFNIILTNQRGEQAKSSCSLSVKGQHFTATVLLHV